MRSITRMLEEAVSIANHRDDDRNFRVGAIAIRADGVAVRAYNGRPDFPEPQHHAEARLCRKLDRGAVVFVGRTTKDGQWALSKPCQDCHQALQRSGAERVYYTVGPGKYAVIRFL